MDVDGGELAPNGPLTQELKDYLKDLGADLVGVGSIDRFRGAPEIFAPRRYLPDARALISIALHVNEAACDLIARSVSSDEVPPSYHSYQMFTLSIVNPQLDQLAYLGAKFLEQRGYRAYPFPANMPHELKPSSEYPGGPGDISHKHVAVACGLGRIGWHSMLITPQFGTRQKLTSIASNAPLLADPMCDQELCDPAQCGFRALAPVRPRPSREPGIRMSASRLEAGPPNMQRSWAGGAAGVAAGCCDVPAATRTSRCPTRSPRPRNSSAIKPRWTRGRKGCGDSAV